MQPETVINDQSAATEELPLSGLWRAPERVPATGQPVVAAGRHRREAERPTVRRGIRLAGPQTLISALGAVGVMALFRGYPAIPLKNLADFVSSLMH